MNVILCEKACLFLEFGKMAIRDFAALHFFPHIRLSQEKQIRGWNSLSVSSLSQASHCETCCWTVLHKSYLLQCLPAWRPASMFVLKACVGAAVGSRIHDKTVTYQFTSLQFWILSFFFFFFYYSSLFLIIIFVVFYHPENNLQLINYNNIILIFF